MISGKIYDPSDKELVALRTKAHRLSKEYNELLETDQKRLDIIKELGISGNSFYLLDKNTPSIITDLGGDELSSLLSKKS